MIALLLLSMLVSHVEGKANVAEGVEVHEGDVIETSADGRVEIALETGTLIRIGENSRVVLRGQSTRFSVQLAFGNFWAKVHKLIAGQSFQVETENGVAGVRGTQFRIEASSGKPDLLRVYEGVVAVGEARVTPGNELRFARAAVEQPRPFDAQTDRQLSFVKWLEKRDADLRNPEREQRRQERIDRQREHRRDQQRKPD